MEILGKAESLIIQTREILHPYLKKNQEDIPGSNGLVNLGNITVLVLLEDFSGHMREESD